MSSLRLHALGFRLGRLAHGLLRVDRWPDRFGPWLESARHVVAFSARRARDVRLLQVAASLTFTTVLALVPLLGVVLSVLSAFPVAAEYRAALDSFLLRGVLPEPYATLILRYLGEFTEQAARLTAVGAAFLIVTALLMILTVDHALNEIWRVRTPRGLMARLLVYWALLTLAPLAVAASVTITSRLAARTLALQEGGLLAGLLEHAPLAIGVFGLTVLYVIVPNRRVLWRDALIGALVATLFAEALTRAFGLYIRTGPVASIYGAFAAVPLFLLWVYLSWFALLFGAAIAATLPMLRATRFSDETRAGNRFVTAVSLLALLLRARASGADGGRMTLHALAEAVRTPDDESEALLEQLERLGYVARLDGLHADEWLLTCDPATATLLPLFSQLAVDPRNSLVAGDVAGVGRWMRSALATDWLAAPLERSLGASATAGRA
jgi:membrane protein